MKKQIFISAVVALFLGSSAFAQMTGNGYGGGGMPQGQAPSTNADRNQQTTTSTTKAKTNVSMSVKDYLDNQIANSKDKKFHLAFNGKDLGLTPVKFHEEKKLGGSKSSTAVDMKGSDGNFYEVVFLSSGGQPNGAKIHPLTATR